MYFRPEPKRPASPNELSRPYRAFPDFPSLSSTFAFCAEAKSQPSGMATDIQKFAPLPSKDCANFADDITAGCMLSSPIAQSGADTTANEHNPLQDKKNVEVRVNQFLASRLVKPVMALIREEAISNMQNGSMGYNAEAQVKAKLNSVSVLDNYVVSRQIKPFDLADYAFDSEGEEPDPANDDHSHERRPMSFIGARNMFHVP